MSGTSGIDLGLQTISLGSRGKPWDGYVPCGVGDGIALDTPTIALSDGGGVWAGSQSRAGYGIDLGIQAIGLGSYAHPWFDGPRTAAGYGRRCEVFAEPHVDGDDAILFTMGNPVDFQAVPRSGTVPFDVDFALVVLSGLYHSPHMVWNFGDGTMSAETTPTHRYRDAGQYNISVQVRADGGEEYTARKKRYIGARWPDRHYAVLRGLMPYEPV